MRYFLHLLLFLVINFGALYIGSLFTQPGVQSEWYASLDKAPWTPPGAVFGIAWSTIMICFSVYMANTWKQTVPGRRFIVIYTAQVIVNILWNIVFFHWHQHLFALVLIVALLIIVLWFLRAGFRMSFLQGMLVLPYVLWLMIAVSLNAYITFLN